MADALLAFGVYGVRKNRHRPAKRPPDLPPHRRARAPHERAGFRQSSCSGACKLPAPALRRKTFRRALQRGPPFCIQEGNAPSAGSRKAAGKAVSAGAGVHAAKALRPCRARPGKRNRAAARLCRETARQQQRAPPGRGLRLLRGSRQRPVPAEAARLFPGGFPLPAARLCGRARAPAAAGAAPVAFCFIYKCRKM